MRNLEWRLEPLSCPSCVKRIEGKLQKTKGIESARVLFHSSKVKVTFNDTVIMPDEIIGILEKLGYPVLSPKSA